jgi:UDP-glucose 4-epimerase
VPILYHLDMVPTDSPQTLPAFSNARVLVVGGGGYIASHLIQRLVADGIRPTVQAGFPDDIRHLEIDLLEGSLDDPAILDAMATFEPEFVFDLAGRTDQSHSRDNDDTMAASHYGNARATARAIWGPSLKRWVRCGTNEEYGHNPVPHVETQREAPVSAYSVSKVAATHHLQMLASAQGCPVVVVRPFVVYGPGQARGFTPFVIRQGFADGAFDTTHGKQTRDFIYVDDLVSGMIAAATTPGIEGEVINLGSGVETPVREMVETVLDIIGAGKPNFGAMELRQGEILRCQADISKAERLLGWKPQVTLREGLTRMVDAARPVADG